MQQLRQTSISGRIWQPKKIWRTCRLESSSNRLFFFSLSNRKTQEQAYNRIVYSLSNCDTCSRRDGHVVASWLTSISTLLHDFLLWPKKKLKKIKKILIRFQGWYLFMRFFLPFIISIFLERVPTGPQRRAIRKTRKLSDSQLPWRKTCPSLLPIPSVVFCSSPLSLSLPPYSSLMDCVIRHQRIPIAIGHTGIKLVCYFFSSPSLPFSSFFFSVSILSHGFLVCIVSPVYLCFKILSFLVIFSPRNKTKQNFWKVRW